MQGTEHGSQGTGDGSRGDDHLSPVPCPPSPRIGIYGIGNVLAHDDAVGPSVVRLVDAGWQLEGDVTVEDLGTPAIELPTHLAGFDAVVLVDAVSATAPPGTLKIYDREAILKYSPG